jgi:hypothetical protein
MATVALSGIITPSNVVTATSTTTLTNKTLTAPTIASANLTTALTLAGAAGTNGQVLTSAGSGLPTWVTPSSGALTLLAVLTPTVAANVDALTTFTATYNNYLIQIDGIKPATDSELYVRFANTGVVDSGSFYGNDASTSSVVATTASFFQLNSGNAASVQSLEIVVKNVNSTTDKALFYRGIYTRPAVPNNNVIQGVGINVKTSTVSGVRFYWDTGSNFVAQGSIRIYGYANT